MATFAKYLLFVSFTAVTSAAWSQKPKTVPEKPAAFQKYTPPPLKSMLGIRTDSASVYVEEAVQLLKLPLKITDDKKNNYTISSYRFMYKRRAVTEDEATGKVTPIMSNISDLFKETPLPDLWVKTITEQIRPGEELYFFDIVAKDSQGRLMFAPELRISVKK